MGESRLPELVAAESTATFFSQVFFLIREIKLQPLENAQIFPRQTNKTVIMYLTPFNLSYFSANMAPVRIWNKNLNPLKVFISIMT